MEKNSRIYFASDVHLGLYPQERSRQREKYFVKWLDKAKEDATEIYLLGDIFDYWYEYKTVVPRGFTRTLGKLAEITDSGIPVHFFTGNHDMWVSDYLCKECGMVIHTKPLTTIFNGKKFHLAHGEGLGTKSKGYKLLLSIFRNEPLRVMYSSLHPSIGVGIGHKWSLSSRLGKGITKEFLGEEKEDLIRYAKSILETDNVDYFLFGHRHLAMSWKLQSNAEIVFLGDWIKNGSYAQWDGENLTLRTLL